METPVTFSNQNGKTLMGILHTPDNPSRTITQLAINILNPGVKCRVSPNRLNVSLARELCSLGFSVLRFDPTGVGDSQGELPEGALIRDIWQAIQKGAFVPDTLASNDVLLNYSKAKGLLLIGTCGGAITALLAATKHPRVSSLCLIDLPIILSTPDLSFADHLPVGSRHAQWLFSEYVKRLARPSAYWRFFTGQTNYKVLLKITHTKAKTILSQIFATRYAAHSVHRQSPLDKLNPHFLEAFHTFSSRGGNILFLLAGRDPSTEIFNKYFRGLYLPRSLKVNSSLTKTIRIQEIPNANHVYSLPGSRQALISSVCTFATSLTMRS